MKTISQLIITIILSCILLTACNSGGGNGISGSNGNNGGGNQPTPAMKEILINPEIESFTPSTLIPESLTPSTPIPESLTPSTPITYKVLYNFTGGTTDGYMPGSLIQGNDGNLYGTTYSGGANNRGTIFKITPQGQETTLYSFTETDVVLQPASLIQASDGNFYGTTKYGGGGTGNQGYGTVFKITLAGVETILHSFTGSTDGEYPISLIQGSDGDLYGTTEFGGSGVCIDSGGENCGTVFKITFAGVKTTLYSFRVGTDGEYPNSLIQGSDGDLYGTTALGGVATCGADGKSNCGTVFKITSQGLLTTLYTFTGGTTDGYMPGSLIKGNDGNFYGTTRYGGSSSGICKSNQLGCGIVFQITPQGQETTLYNFTTDGYEPYNLIQGSDGNFYGTSNNSVNNNYETIFQITPQGQETTLYTSTAGGVYPNGLIQGNDGNLYGVTTGGGIVNPDDCFYGNLYSCGTVFKITINNN